MKDQAVCHLHGGKSPKALEAVDRRRALAAAGEALASMGVPVDTDPGEALLALVAEAAGNVVFLRGRVQSLEQAYRGLTIVRDDDAEGSVSSVDAMALAGPVDPRTWKADRHVYAAMYESWCDRLAEYSALALRAGVEERRVRLAQADGERVFVAMDRAWDAAGLSREQWGAFRAALAEELRRGVG